MRKIALLLCLLACPAAAQPMMTIVSPPQSAAEHVTNMLVRHATQRIPDVWVQQVARLRNLPRNRQIREVNAYFNSFRYQRTTGYQTPAELIKRGSGDCKDLSFGKLLMLHDLKVPGARVVVATIKVTGVLHQYVIVPREDGTHMILDNLLHEPIEAVKLGDRYKVEYRFPTNLVLEYAVLLQDYFK